jgi:hypothetical protein
MQVLAQSPLLAGAVGDEHVDASAQSGLRLLLEIVNVDDIEILIDALAHDRERRVLGLLGHLGPSQPRLGQCCRGKARADEVQHLPA